MKHAPKNKISNWLAGRLGLWLLLALTLFMPQNRVWGFSANPVPEVGKTVIQSSMFIGENGDQIQYDASGYTVAPKTAVRNNFNVYETIVESPISGTTRGAHRASANRNLFSRLQGDADFASALNRELGTDVMQHMQSGAGRNLLNPPGTVWHHSIDNPGAMQLLRQGEHVNPALQSILHPGPNGSGGFSTFFGNP